jgi:hypothetical protein
MGCVRVLRSLQHRTVAFHGYTAQIVDRRVIDSDLGASASGDPRSPPFPLSPAKPQKLGWHSGTLRLPVPVRLRLGAIGTHSKYSRLVPRPGDPRHRTGSDGYAANSCQNHDL